MQKGDIVRLLTEAGVYYDAIGAFRHGEVIVPTAEGEVTLLGDGINALVKDPTGHVDEFDEPGLKEYINNQWRTTL